MAGNGIRSFRKSMEYARARDATSEGSRAHKLAYAEWEGAARSRVSHHTRRGRPVREHLRRRR